MRRIVWTFVVLGVGVALWFSQRPHGNAPLLQRTQKTGEVVEENHLSPEENLEQVDLAQLDGARRSLDIAMYAFTDRYLAESILRAAHRGVRVRIYRDHSEYESEERNSGRNANQSTSEMFRGERNIQVRVKRSRELMHLKAYCVDGEMLRDGSANWSPSGLKRQDNNARFTTDTRQVQAFENTFEGLWERDNEVLQ